jgi:hypothetical protein
MREFPEKRKTGFHGFIILMNDMVLRISVTSLEAE